MRAIELSRGKRMGYMNNLVNADWYTVVYEGKIIVRTTNKRVAWHYYSRLPQKGSTQ